MFAALSLYLMLAALFLVVLAVLVLPSIRVIGPAEVGLVMKRFGARLPDDNPVALGGEAGYQAELLMPGLRFRLWLLYHVSKYPWVQVPAGEIAVVIAQIGRSLPAGAKSGVYRAEFGDFTDVRAFIDGGGEKGVQRKVLAPGALLPLHPVAFLAITKRGVYGLRVWEELTSCARSGVLASESMHLAIHLAYRLGQVDYRRRMVTGEADKIGAALPTELSSAPIMG